ncbi:hypothetical protein ACFYXH_02710 [Streptomyces sp. NPDC002730]|uniref:hypothetical protein n=1 Tax=Streptomyces sp. NPDC002730 TaxID=3364662 RepID=UPI003679899C
MAEISYPFNADSPDGGTSVVSQTQWQAMAALWGGDRVDFQLTGNSYSATALPFTARIVNGRSVEIDPGKAWVGGFYYSLTATKAVTIASNATALARKDIIVIQADMAKSAVNLAVVQGTPAATPIAPTPRRQAGGIWEMVLYEVDAAANNVSVSFSLRAPFNPAPRASFPWNAAASARFLPMGSLSLDLDSDGGERQQEGFRGRDGYVVARDLGKAQTYKPSLYFDANLPASGISYLGRWRWIAPNTVWFSALITNNLAVNMSSDNAVAYAVALPVPASGKTGQVITGYLSNPSRGGGYPTVTSLLGRVAPSATRASFAVYIPSPSNPGQGLDNFRTFPAKAAINFSGVYEANAFKE